jgi:hypothetical protein
MTGFLDERRLREFFFGWGEVVQVIERVKAASSGGRLIQYPKIPSAVSESLAARVLIARAVFPEARSMLRGGGADIRVVCGTSTYRVEVKGSGSSEFQTLGRKDYDCDLLVWLRFGEAVQLGLEGEMRVTLFQTPRRCFGDLGNRVSHATAVSAADPSMVRSLVFRLADLLDQ